MLWTSTLMRIFQNNFNKIERLNIQPLEMLTTALISEDINLRNNIRPSSQNGENSFVSDDIFVLSMTMLV